jgi:hypothetical protein
LRSAKNFDILRRRNDKDAVTARTCFDFTSLRQQMTCLDFTIPDHPTTCRDFILETIKTTKYTPTATTSTIFNSLERRNATSFLTALPSNKFFFEQIPHNLDKSKRMLNYC